MRHAGFIVASRQTRNGPPQVTPTPTPPTPPSETLLGVGSVSTSLTDYPKVQNTTSGNWFVDASVSSSGVGTTLATAFKTLAEGLSALSSGDTLIVKGGTYVITSTINRSTNWTEQTRIMGYGTDRPVLDFNGISARCIYFTGSNELWHRFHIKNNNMVRGEVHTGHEGFYAFTGASDLVWSDIWASHLGGEGFRHYRVEDSRVLDCATWKLGDPNLNPNFVSPPDGFICSGSGTTGGESKNNVFARCIAINAPDDGFDCYSGIDNLFVDCVAYRCGYYYNGVSGRGKNGLKMGGGTGRRNIAKGCFVGFNGRGFEFNGGPEADCLNVTAVGHTQPDSAKVGIRAGSGGDVYDNISLTNTTNHSLGAVNQSNNTWNLGITEAQFASPGAPGWDYSLVSTSPCVGAGRGGVNLGASTAALELAKEWLAKDLT